MSVENDRDRMFADWGVTIVLRHAAQAYDPEAGQLEEAISDRELTAVVGQVEVAAAAGTAGQHTARAIRFLLRDEDIPGEVTLRTSRIVHGEREYQIDAVETSIAGVTAVSCIAV